MAGAGNRMGTCRGFRLLGLWMWRQDHSVGTVGGEGWGGGRARGWGGQVQGMRWGQCGEGGLAWLLCGQCRVRLLQVATHSPSGLHSPEQRSFRERQKYFEIEVKQQQMDKPPKRVSLVGEDDLKKMKEEEGMLQSVQGNLAC